MKEDISSILAIHLLKELKDQVSLGRQNNLLINKAPAKSLKKYYYNEEDLLDELGIYREVKSNKTDIIELDASIKSMMAITLIQRKKELADKRKEELISKYTMGEKMTVDDIVVFIDMDESKETNHANKFLVNKKTGSIIDVMTVTAFKQIMGHEEFNELIPMMDLAKRRYDPYRINNDLNDKIWKEEIENIPNEVTFINECKHPSWRYSRDKTIRLSDDDIHFIETSFQNKSDLQYFINAAYTTITDKMWVYILLFGIKGTGKTTLIEMLINCVGKTNYRKAPQNALKSGFNSYKKNKRLILMDEMAVNTDEIVNILKSDANKEMNVEEKHKESMSVKNFASTWFASNNLRDWNFTYDERRFSTLELVRETTLERGISDKWMSDFSERIETDEFSQGLFNYLEENKTDHFNSMLPYKSDLFYKIVSSSLSGWASTIVDYITTDERVDQLFMSVVLEQDSKYAIRRAVTIEDFIDNYRHYDKKDKNLYSLGKFYKGKSIPNSYIIPSEKYRAPKFNQELSND